MKSGDLIKKFREEKGLSQSQLAKKMNVTKAYIYQYEAGKRVPKTDTLQRFADALGIPYYWLVVDAPSAIKTKEQFYSSFDDALGAIQRLDIPEGEKVAAVQSLISDLAGKAFDADQVRIDPNAFLSDIVDKATDQRHRMQFDDRRNKIEELLDKLNDLGLEEAKRQLEMLVEIPRFTEKVDYIDISAEEYNHLIASSKVYSELQSVVKSLPAETPPEVLMKKLEDVFRKFNYLPKQDSDK